MDLQNYKDFLTEANRIEKAGDDKRNAASKEDKFDNKSSASKVEYKMHADREKMEKNVQELKAKLETSTSDQEKGKIKDQIRNLKGDWKKSKEKYKIKLKAMRS